MVELFLFAPPNAILQEPHPRKYQEKNQEIAQNSRCGVSHPVRQIGDGQHSRAEHGKIDARLFHDAPVFLLPDDGRAPQTAPEQTASAVWKATAPACSPSSGSARTQGRNAPLPHPKEMMRLITCPIRESPGETLQKPPGSHIFLHFPPSSLYSQSAFDLLTYRGTHRPSKPSRSVTQMVPARLMSKFLLSAC